VIVGFDLDGTLDRPGMAELAMELNEAGHMVHIITASFTESGDWQSNDAKFEKLLRLGFDEDQIQWASDIDEQPIDQSVMLHVLKAVVPEFGTEYRQRDIALRKGNLCERLGIQIMFDDSKLYCETMKAMCGTTIVHVQ